MILQEAMTTGIV